MKGLFHRHFLNEIGKAVAMKIGQSNVIIKFLKTSTWKRADVKHLMKCRFALGQLASCQQSSVVSDCQSLWKTAIAISVKKRYKITRGMLYHLHTFKTLVWFFLYSHRSHTETSSMQMYLRKDYHGDNKDHYQYCQNGNSGDWSGFKARFCWFSFPLSGTLI